MANPDLIKKIRLLKTLVFILGFLNFLFIAYIIFLPLFPLIKYQISQPFSEKINPNEKAIVSLNQQAPQLPAHEIIKSLNRVIIKKIGVDVPVVEASEADSMKALNKGAWRIPQTSTPNKGGNTVISAHRFKYLPPNNLTFYLLDKLTVGDIISVIWEHKQYDYKVKESKIVPPTEISILDPTDKPILTLFTCDPIWSEKNRLVIAAELIEKNSLIDKLKKQKLLP